MTLPKQADVEIPLLMEIEKAGGKARPKDLYPRVTAHFPQITQEDLERILPAGNPHWTNRVQFVRQALVQKGELDGSVRGIWAITEAGRRRLDAHRKCIPYKPPKVPAKKPTTKVKPTTARVDHDEIARALEKIGTAFGFDTFWKPKVNELRPDRRAFKSKRKTLDVAWKIANLTWVPIEVQVRGSVPDLIYRFQQVHQWSVRVVVVAVPSYQDEIREAVHDYPFRDKIVVLGPEQVLRATRSLDGLLELKAAIFES